MKYACIVYRRYFNGREVVKWSGEYRYLVIAKLMTKLHAIWVDVCTPDLDGDVGIYWEIRKGIKP